MSVERNKWERELKVFGQLNSAIALTGNIYDIIPYYSGGKIAALYTLEQYLCRYFLERRYQNVVGYDMVQGFYDLYRKEESGLQELQKLIQTDRQNTNSSGQRQSGLNYTIHQYGNQKCLTPESLEDAAHMIQLLMNYSTHSTGLIVQFASQMVARPDDLAIDERMTFLYLRKGAEKARWIQTEPAGKDAQGNNRRAAANMNQMFLLTDKLNDLPAWFYLSFPQLKIINIERPNYRMREEFIRQMAVYFSGYREADADQKQTFLDRFVGQTEGFTYTDLNHVRILAQKQKFDVQHVDQAVMLYRHGVQENPWTKMKASELSSLESNISRQVLGQPVVVRQAVDIIKRAVTGISGLQHSSSWSKPRGIMFLAGPTGTGKTELAKAITKQIFKDERNMIRFDMSEYRQAQSDQRLLGAPPGYVGYEAGGQLTNAVREHPFSVLLFDEIEKAHPSLMDKFLQILEDGRITDGRGETVYFQDCLIIFTSNLGITRPSATDPGRRIVNVSYEQDREYESVRTKVLEGVRSYFNEELGRPEILNRIGNNILVFDFIREDSLNGILNRQIQNIKTRLMQDHSIRLQLEQGARTKIWQFAKEQLPKGQGGRGIGNVMEEKLLNPLARYIFDQQVGRGELIVVHDIVEDTLGLPCLNAERRRS